MCVCVCHSVCVCMCVTCMQCSYGRVLRRTVRMLSLGLSVYSTLLDESRLSRERRPFSHQISLSTWCNLLLTDSGKKTQRSRQSIIASTVLSSALVALQRGVVKYRYFTTLRTSEEL